MAEKDIQRYIDGIESQHKTRPKYIAHLSAMLEKVDAAHGAAKDMPAAFYVLQASGEQLDVIGINVGVDRRFPLVSIPGLPGKLSDSVYRKVILAKIVQNQWDGTEETFREIWDNTVGADGLDAYYQDNQDMTMDVMISGTMEPIMTELILAGYIFPKPLGVKVNVSVASTVEPPPIHYGAAPVMNYARIKIGKGEQSNGGQRVSD